MIERVKAFSQKHNLFTKNATILVGVSGGPDSMALLHYLSTIQAEWSLHMIAIAIDHQLRGEESKSDVHYVEETCKKWGVEFVGKQVDVDSFKKKSKLGTQAAARKLRYEYFAEQMETYNADLLALAHHGDDQVETMLMNFVRSSNPKALSGIPVKRPFAKGKIIRPFLCVTKLELEAYCKENGITPRIDPSNAKDVYTRNFVRKHILPLLKEKNSSIHITTQRLSESLQEDEQYLNQEAKKMFSHVAEIDQTKCEVLIDIPTYQSYPYALQRRTFHLILNYLYEEFPKNLSYVHEDQFFGLLENTSGNQKIDFPLHLKLEKSYRNLLFRFLEKQPLQSDFHMTLDVPGEIKLPNGATLSAIYTDNPSNHSIGTYICNADQVTLPLHIRTRKEGDRMRWKGLNGSKKIKDIFIDAKIPLEQRETWPLVEDNDGDILWLIGVKKGIPTKQMENNTYIQLHYDKGNA
ncbi:tRNA lysidine(34) synthetase TilS [Oceanobacillus halotolerans]|uniref:tRNA lysidine(34) synthetase TilS n=1 Tax=Oceanobacillus halotolerans TaxID=2663380 RepID=UPI0013DABAEC|nr:tRNA lysidine(34) synthetase TilS [Oceanobacillus halotolerans]